MSASKEKSMPRRTKDRRDLAITRGLGESLAKKRLELGLSQADLASAVGLGRTSISSFERGASMPTIRTLEDLCSALNTDPNTALGWN